MKKTLSTAFADSLKEESIACIGEYAEIGLDAVMEDGILKDIPIVSTVIAVYKIGSSIKILSMSTTRTTKRMRLLSSLRI